MKCIQLIGWKAIVRVPDDLADRKVMAKQAVYKPREPWKKMGRLTASTHAELIKMVKESE